MIDSQPPVIRMTDLSKRFESKKDLFDKIASLGRQSSAHAVHAVNGINLDIMQGEVLGLVGESGCGKSTLGRMVAGLMRRSSGMLTYKGADVQDLSGKAWLDYMLSVQMVFQDPQASLNPQQRLHEILSEPLRVHRLVSSSAEAQERVNHALNEVGLSVEYRDRFPHQISGGQRQRIGIARALMVNPSFLVCDEPVAALDVSIQAQVINLFMDLRDQYGLTYLFISHDLGVVRHISDRVAIMYLGKIVELASTQDIFDNPNHPYTQALLSEMPSVKHRGRKFTPIKGEIPSPLNPPRGCTFHPRCPRAMPICSEEAPRYQEVASSHFSSCHLND